MWAEPFLDGHDGFIQPNAVLSLIKPSHKWPLTPATQGRGRRFCLVIPAVAERPVEDVQIPSVWLRSRVSASICLTPLKQGRNIHLDSGFLVQLIWLSLTFRLQQRVWLTVIAMVKQW